MTAVWFTSDTHFLHALVSGNRGFSSVEWHDEEIIMRWNAAVKPDDMVWHLGDVGLGNEARVLELAARLNGVKHLVAGNHDRCWPGHRDARKRQRAWLGVFESVQAFAKARVDGRTVLLSHLPYQDAGDHTAEERYPQFRLPDLGEWLVHGHTHSGERVDGPRSVHAGLDAWGLRPVSEGEIAALIREAEEREAGSAIHEHGDGKFSIASGGAWLPGLYADKKAARWAFQFTDEELMQLSARVCHPDSGEGRAITVDDLKLAGKA